MFDAKNSGALQGVKIIELAGLGTVPCACMILGDMGAEVIRIDNNAFQQLSLPIALLLHQKISTKFPVPLFARFRCR